MDKIKSAYEMAMERFQQREEVPRAEIDRLEHLPIGRSLAVDYLRESNYDLVAAIDKQSADKKKYIIEGAQEIFLNSIILPVDERAMETNKKAMAGLLLIKEDKQAVTEIFGQLEYLFDYYTQTLAQAYQQFREDYSAKISAAAQSAGLPAEEMQNIDPEKYQGFREEWSKWQGRLNNQYTSTLKEQKDKLRRVS